MLYRFEENQELAWGKAPFSIQAIAQDVNQLIYSQAFVDSRFASGFKERRTHGMAHVSRAALIGGAGYQLMASLGIEGLDSMSEEARAEEFKLVQIALLLHDSGCESDAKDTHDADSGLNLYHYLTERLGLAREKARMVAEAMTNKDWTPGEVYCTLSMNEPLHFEEHLAQVNPFSLEVNRLRLAIQFGDSIDFLRTGMKFNKGLLQLYNQHYDDPRIHEQIQKISEIILNEDLSLITSFRRAMSIRIAGGLDVNGEQAFEFALTQMRSKAPLLTSLYEEGRIPNLDEVLLVNNQKGKPFFYKTLRADAACFWPDFIYNLIDGAPTQLRPRARDAYTTRIGKNQNYEIVPTNKKHPDRKPLFTPEQKAQTTPAQSVSYANPATDYLPTAFGHDMRDLLVGIMTPTREEEGIYTTRIFLSDLGTIERTFEGPSKNKLRRTLEEKLAGNIYHTTLKSLEDAGKLNQEEHNEIMARLRWVENNDDYQVMIFSDNLASRILAQARALDIHYSIVERRKRQGLPPEGDYVPKIMFYPALTQYSEIEQESDLKSDQSLLGKALRSVLINEPITLDEKCEYFHQYGNQLSRYLNLEILGPSLNSLYMVYLKDKVVHRKKLEATIDALPADNLVKILSDPKHLMHEAVCSIYLDDRAKLGALLFRINSDDWSTLLGAQGLRDKLLRAMNSSSNWVHIFIKLPQSLWRKLLSTSPFSSLINTLDAQGLSPLCYVLDEHHYGVIRIKMMEALLKAGANAHITSRIRQYPLHLACESGDGELVELCLKNGADPLRVDASKKSPLEIALENNHHDLAMTFLKQWKDHNLLTSKEGTLLHLAVQYGVETLMDDLIQDHANIHAQDSDGMTPLHYAVRKNQRKVVNKLIKAGAMVDSLDKHGNTPLFYSFKYLPEEPDLVHDLINAGADPNRRDSSKSPLFCELLSSRASDTLALAVLPLIRDINLQNNNGDTPLHLAILREQYELAKQLIVLGADLKILNNRDESVFQLACEQGNLSLFESFLEKQFNVHQPIGKKNETPLIFSARHGNLEIVKKLIALKVDLNSKDSEGNTALSVAIDQDCFAIAKALLEAGASPDPDCVDYTPLMMAVFQENMELVSLLYKKGADINRKTKWGKTALHLSIRNHRSVAFSFLIKHGAAVNQADYAGLTPLHYACDNPDRLEFMKILLRKGANPLARDGGGQTPLDYLLCSLVRRKHNFEMALEYIRLRPDIINSDSFQFDRFPSEYWPTLFEIQAMPETTLPEVKDLPVAKKMKLKR